MIDLLQGGEVSHKVHMRCLKVHPPISLESIFPDTFKFLLYCDTMRLRELGSYVCKYAQVARAHTRIDHID